MQAISLLFLTSTFGCGLILLTMTIDSIELTKQLVALPSAKSSHGTYGPMECDVAAAIKKFCDQSRPLWRVDRQHVGDGRENLLVHDGTPIKVLFIGHMDVIETGDGWRYNPQGFEEGDRLYGRGAADMKGGVAVMLTTLAHAAQKGISGVAGLFYCDEEYKFLGMKEFVKEYGHSLNPKIVICPEPTGLGIREGVRGCVEYQVIVKGKRGHAARPHMGVNAFRALVSGVQALDDLCARHDNPVLGKATVNITGVRCGTLNNEIGEEVILGSKGNVIPDYCEAVVEVRVTPEVRGEMVAEALRQGIEDCGGQLVKADCHVNMGSFLTNRSLLGALEEAQRKVLGEVLYDDPARGGYSDIQLLAECWNTPCVLLGPTGFGMHGADEYVEKDSIEKLERIFITFIEDFL